MKRAPDYRGAALLGLAQERLRKRQEKAAADKIRLDKIQETLEERRMMALAATIHTEELLQQLLGQIEDPAMRDAVEKRLRPHTKIPVEAHG